MAHPGKALQGHPAFEEDPEPRSPGHPAGEGRGHRDHQGAGAGEEEGQGLVEVAPEVPPKEGKHKRHEGREEEDKGRVAAAKGIYEALHLRLLQKGLFGKAGHLGKEPLFRKALHPHEEASAFHEASPVDPLPHPLGLREGLPGKGRLLHPGLSRNHPPVRRHPFPLGYPHPVPHPQGGKGHLLHPFSLHPERPPREKASQGEEGLPGLGRGLGLEDLPHQEKKDHHRRLLRRPDGQGSKGGEAHQDLHAEGVFAEATKPS